MMNEAGTSTRPGFNIAVCQFAPGADAAENLRVVREFTQRATDRLARLVVFPEYTSFFAEPMGPQFVDAAEDLDGPFVTELAKLAAEFNVFLVAGMVERAEARRVANTLVAIAPRGGLIASYRKQHLYDAFGVRESDWVVPGDLAPPQTFAVDGVTVGMQTCYDIRFPEVTRRLVDAGAELVLVPAEWVRGPLKEHHWRSLLIARAIENTVYVAAADHTPPVGVGGSAIIDPMGVAIAELGEQPDLAVGWMSPARVAQVRAVNPALALRRYRVLPA